MSRILIKKAVGPRGSTPSVRLMVASGDVGGAVGEGGGGRPWVCVCLLCAWLWAVWSVCLSVCLSVGAVLLCDAYI